MASIFMMPAIFYFKPKEITEINLSAIYFHSFVITYSSRMPCQTLLCCNSYRTKHYR